ncbi:macro domain-containing protein [Pelagibaculum spongiae]|uniref:Macro domain-containing protein n=1 Tax=Pelagibaculum spongiae TaxID=2080658 RepID=A0A2V1GQY9_9GAMM|nr:macro domain-containing protein [Pelagibaculum spongiae]PVZ66411.1 hypothetical protein DC094_17100 [Pelagibaculum spongiae]
MAIEIIKGDLVTMQVDAIVNAANEQLTEGGGVCGAIFQAAGEGLAEECAEQAPCPPGEARITHGFDLPSKFLIHAVGPVWEGGRSHEATVLADAYRYSLLVADANHCKSIAFPAISTGIYGYPSVMASEVALKVCKQFLQRQSESIETIYVVLFSEDDYQIWQESWTHLNR